MKIFLNLLPEERKKKIRRKMLFSLIIEQEVFLLIPVVILIVILACASYLLRLQSQAGTIEREGSDTTQKYKELKEYEDTFVDMNKRVVAIDKIQKAQLHWSRLFDMLEQITPEGVRLGNLSTKDYQIFIAGKAVKRENLIAFKEKIEQNECVSDVNVPLSNLVERENVAFQIDFKMKEECLKK